MLNTNDFDVVIIGGGFYGCSIALEMKKYYQRVVIVEKEAELLIHASLINQARVHNGYHYPRSMVTAYRSFINFPIFTNEFERCVVSDFTKLYAIAKGSKVNAYRFHQMFNEMGAPIEKAEPKYNKLFNNDLIEDVFLVKEYAFDAFILRDILLERLDAAGIPILYNTEVMAIQKSDNSPSLNILLDNGEVLSTKYTFNCTYSQINKLMRGSDLPLLPMKNELTEMALIEVPDEIKNVGITVMDGLYFSTMPYPAKKVHSLSHVRYTPHFSWVDQEDFMDGHIYLKNTAVKSNYSYMLKDAQRYLPSIAESKYIESIFEIKTVLIQNEDDDGRPILYREDYGHENIFNVMGGKIDNIYDILDKIQSNKKLVKDIALTGTQK
ncbi:MAG: FAD-binding oxidoreductase [Bacillales bacterium]|jgi:glycine/D-amino acid oxidase-like deaminating enzyme|nr:FAD-binding oxidoreductase [Bacillales bacterium]